MLSCEMLRRVAQIVFVHSVLRFLVVVNIAASSTILVTQMIEGIRSSETSVLTTSTQRNIPEDGILYMEKQFYS
jgi:hypothetical protein